MYGNLSRLSSINNYAPSVVTLHVCSVQVRGFVINISLNIVMRKMRVTKCKLCGSPISSTNTNPYLNQWALAPLNHLFLPPQSLSSKLFLQQLSRKGQFQLNSPTFMKQKTNSVPNTQQRESLRFVRKLNSCLPLVGCRERS